MNSKSKRSPGRPPKAGGTDPQTESRLLQTASELFMEYGYEQVSLELIAERCQVTKATIYYYFSSKPQFFTESVVQVLQRAREITIHLLAEPKPLKDRLILIATGHLRTNRADFPTMMKEAGAHLTDEQAARIRQAEHDIHGVMVDAFREASAEGQLLPLPPLFLSHAFSALLMLGNRQPVMDAYSTPEDAAKHIVSLFLEGAAVR
jgi:TetR/AcrR family transcriptional regulator, mexJK operon transcriptional repressor